jgi:hypothetical protein
MSVAVYSDDELARLWFRLGGSDDVGYALVALGTANRAAYMLTYTDCDSIERVSLSEPAVEGKPPVDTWSCTQWVRNLLYNCISNGGRDFADSRAAETLLNAAARQEAKLLLAAATGSAPQPAFGLATERLEMQARATREGMELRRRLLETLGQSPDDGEIRDAEDRLAHIGRLRAGLNEIANEAMEDVNYVGHPMHY